VNSPAKYVNSPAKCVNSPAMCVNSPAMCVNLPSDRARRERRAALYLPAAVERGRLLQGGFLHGQ
jgi:hypothetical protein